MDPYQGARMKHHIERRFNKLENQLIKDEYMFSSDLWDKINQLEKDVVEGDWGGYNHNIEHYQHRLHKLKSKIIIPCWWICC
jgi:hypothetical protein